MFCSVFVCGVIPLKQKFSSEVNFSCMLLECMPKLRPVKTIVVIIVKKKKKKIVVVVVVIMVIQSRVFVQTSNFRSVVASL